MYSYVKCIVKDRYNKKSFGRFKKKNVDIIHLLGGNELSIYSILSVN